jgi:GT2 family glycosyltransferase
MNSDVLLTQSALNMMQHCLLEQQDVGAVGVVPLQLNGKKQRSFGTLALYFPNYFKVTKPMQVGVLHGFCIATRRDVLLKVGGFDENFFLYNEEFDWSWRVRKSGLRLKILPETATHFGGSSTVQSPEIMFEGHRGGMYLVKKHFPHWSSALIRRCFQAIAWTMSRLERRQEYQQAWEKLEDCFKRGEYLESPFPLSGRGEVRFEAQTDQKSC